MKDTALAALKRSAKAVLKGELRALRQQIRAQKQYIENCSETVGHLQRELADARRAATSYSNELGRIRDRANRAANWASVHAAPQGNRVALCLTQYVRDDVGGSGFGIVHPFDRWGITPKP